jgi:hypothetical protein
VEPVLHVLVVEPVLVLLPVLEQVLAVELVPVRTLVVEPVLVLRVSVMLYLILF